MSDYQQIRLKEQKQVLRVMADYVDFYQRHHRHAPPCIHLTPLQHQVYRETAERLVAETLNTTIRPDTFRGIPVRAVTLKGVSNG